MVQWSAHLHVQHHQHLLFRRQPLFLRWSHNSHHHRRHLSNLVKFHYLSKLNPLQCRVTEKRKMWGRAVTRAYIQFHKLHLLLQTSMYVFAPKAHCPSLMNIICGHTVHNIIISPHFSINVFKGLMSILVANFDTILWICLFKSVVSHMHSCREVLVCLCVTWVRDCS